MHLHKEEITNMKNNILPFGIIAIVGIFAAIIVFYVGVAQKEEVRIANEGGEEVAENGEGEVALDGDAIYAQSCVSCHGADLSGTVGPDLTQIGSKLSSDEITEIVLNGQGDMPPVDLSPEDADILAEWLSEKQ